MVLGGRSGVSHMTGAVILACSGLRQERDVWVSKMKIRCSSQVVPKGARLNGEDASTELMPVFFCRKIYRVRVFRVQEAPGTLGVGEGIFKFSEGLCMELAGTISGVADAWCVKVAQGDMRQVALVEGIF
eukprot:1137727-Pelagomonas_calceolata.AAC.3